MTDLPNPGSKEARELGCKCPTIDNAQGRGIYVSGAYRFVTVHGCPLHWPTESEPSSLTLAEATETARRILAADPNGKSALLPVIATLLQAARRLQAMESAPLDGRKVLEEYAAKARAFDLTKTADEIQVILDLASDQSAARARVAELERALDGQTFVLPISFGWQPIETIPDVENRQLLVRHSAGYFALIAQVDGDWLDPNGAVDLEDFTHWTQVIEPEVTP